MSRRNPKIPDKILPRITKVFVTNLPDKCSGNDLSDFTQSYGDIYDIYIARKRDKNGNRFGFISFLDVKDSKELIRQITNTRIGDCWLKANIARFTVEEGEIRLEFEKTETKKPVDTEARKETRPPVLNQSFVDGSRSFTDTLLGRTSKVSTGKTILVDSTVNAFQVLHGKAVVATMNDLEALKSIHLIMNDLCPDYGKVM